MVFIVLVNKIDCISYTIIIIINTSKIVNKIFITPANIYTKLKFAKPIHILITCGHIHFIICGS